MGSLKPEVIHIGKSYAIKMNIETNDEILEKLLSLGLRLDRDESPTVYEDYYLIVKGFEFDVVRGVPDGVSIVPFSNYYNQLKSITTKTAPKIEEFVEGISYFRDGKWHNFSKDTNYFDFVTSELFRVLPVRKITQIVEYPEPLKEPPNLHEKYYYIDFYSENCYLKRLWIGDEEDINILKNGAAFSTKEQIVEYIKAYKQAFNIKEV